MAWIILTIVFGLVGILAALVIVARKNAVVAGLVTFSIIALWVLLTLFMSFTRVGAGEVALLKGISGDYIGQAGSGVHWIAPWKSAQVVSVQKLEFRGFSTCSDDAHTKNCLDTFTKDNNDAFVVASMNYHVDPENIQELYRSYPDFIHTIIDTRFQQAVKDETVNYTAEEIAPNREEIRQAILDRLKKELAPFSIAVDGFSLPNIEFRGDLKAKFEAKAAAKVTADTETALIAAEEAKAKQAAASAQGDADKLRITAQGQADANKLINQSLTPELIQFQMIQKLADKISVIMLPSGTNSLFDVSKLVPAQGQ